MSTARNILGRRRSAYRVTAALLLSLMVNGAIFAVAPLLLDRGISPLLSPHALLNLMMPLRPKPPEPEVEEPEVPVELPKLELLPMEVETEPPPSPEIAPPELEIPEMEVSPVTPPTPLLEQTAPEMPVLEIDMKSLPAASVPIAVNVSPAMAKNPQIKHPTPATPTAATAPAVIENREYGIGEVDAGPTALGQALPPYPRRARRRGIEGWVKVRFVITKKGRVRNLSVLSESPKGVFHKTVLKTVPNWRFKPAKKNGQPVDLWVEQTINFKLDR